MLVGMTKPTRKPPTTPAEQLPLTVPEAAAELRVATATLRRWIAQGTVLAIRPGKAYLIPRQELDRLLGRAGSRRAS